MWILVLLLSSSVGCSPVTPPLWASVSSSVTQAKELGSHGMAMTIKLDKILKGLPLLQSSPVTSSGN